MLQKNITIFHPYLVERGGSQRYTFELFNALRSNNYNVEILTFYYNEEKCFNEYSANAKVISLYKVKNYKRADSYFLRFNFINILLNNSGILILLNYIKILYLVRKLINKKLLNYNNQIIVNESGVFNIIAKYYRSSLLIIYDTNNKIIKWNKKGKFIEKFNIFIDKIILLFTSYHWIKSYNKVFVLDEETKLNVYKYYKINSSIIKPGVVSIIQKNKDPNKEKLKILCNSRITSYKRIEDVIEVGKLLKLNEKNFFIEINAPIENNKYYLFLINLINLYNLENHIILNVKHFNDDNELLDSYKRNDIFIFPSENQTWGQAVLEAMAMGLVVIVSRGCGIHRQITNNKNGFIYDTGNISQLFNIINAINFKNFREISKNAIEFANNNYNWNNTLKLLNE